MRWPRSARRICAFERETSELLHASGIALSEAGAALLYQRPRWAAGLRLAAISLAGHLDPERFVAEFSGSERTVAEYLLAEMLERQRPTSRTCFAYLAGRPGQRRAGRPADRLGWARNGFC
jgi:ATP/maltotriose-dependent transcriptional regulator MalT